MLRVFATSIIMYYASQLLIAGSNRLIVRKQYYILYNMLSVFCIYSFLNMFLWDYEINFLIVITFIYVLSIAMFYVHEFRGTNLNFSDILSINTAREVASGYKYEIKISFIIFLLFIVFEYIFHIKIAGINIFKNYHKVINGIGSINIDIYRFFWHEIGQVLAFFISFFILRDHISNKQFDYSLFAGENEGYLFNFISSVPIFHKNKFNYKETARIAKGFIYNILTRINKNDIKNDKGKISIDMEKYKKYASTEKDAPHVIVIMNESFGSVHERVTTDVKVTSYFDNLEGSIKGNLYVNTFGGGTANTEFEFLTGMTIGNYSYPVMPYNNFVRKNKYSIARYFNNLGYKTIAMHPYTPTNYHRDKVYKHFGFDELVFFKDVKNKFYVRNFISDECMYNEIVRRYRMIKSQEQKMFLFGVTMQNHSGYRNYKNGGVMSLIRNVKNREELDGYLSLMKVSDDAIKAIIEYFKNEDERVIILFFGDHNASFGTELNRELYDNSIEYSCTNAYKVPFFIYDNKYPEEKNIDNISANFLSIELLKKANLPFDMIHELMNEVYSNNSTYNFHKMKNRATGEMSDIPQDKFMMLEMEYLR